MTARDTMEDATGDGRVGVKVVVVDDATVIRESLPALLPALSFTGSFANVEAMLRGSAEGRAKRFMRATVHAIE